MLARVGDVAVGEGWLTDSRIRLLILNFIVRLRFLRLHSVSSLVRCVSVWYNLYIHNPQMWGFYFPTPLYLVHVVTPTLGRRLE